jgi:RNA polymerase sigma factor (sigma-70 family)
MGSSAPRMATRTATPMSTIATRAAVRGPLRLGRLGDDRLAALAAAGDERAFEVLYDRHHRALLGFCRHMVGSREEAEDALQQTFLRAHRALAEHGPPADLRPWLFIIARNRCRTLLAARRPEADGPTEVASTAGLGEQVQARADLRAVVADVERLPDEQRAALVLAELADLSHDQIAEVIGVRPGKVKALIHQARTTLIAERDAREAPCESIREQLATARGGALRRGPLRRHLRLCAPCRAYREAVAEQRSALALVLPATPSLGLKAGILGAASATGGAGAAAVGGVGAAASLGGGLAAKLAAAALLVGGTTAGGLAAVDRSSPPPPPPRAAAEAPMRAPAWAPTAPRAAVTSPVAAERGSSHTATSRRGSRPNRHAGKGSVRPASRAHGRALATGRAQAPGQVRKVTGGRPPQAQAKSKSKAQAKAPARAARPAPGHAQGPKRAKPVKPEKPAKPVSPVKVKPAHPPKPVNAVKPPKG